LTDEQRQDRIKAGYDDGKRVNIDDNEVRRIREVVRKHIFCLTKFVPGEGSPTGTRGRDMTSSTSSNSQRDVNSSSSDSEGDEENNDSSSHRSSQVVSPQENPKRRRIGSYKETPEYGKSHERPDLTILRGYPWKIIVEMGLDKGRNNDDYSRAVWWKCVNQFVKHEIQQLRGNRSSEMKKSIMEG